MNKSPFIIRVVFLGFTAVLTWIILVANSGGSNFILRAVDAIPNGDKIGHFFVMGFLAYLANLLLGCKTFRMWGRNVLTGTVIVCIFVVSEEITQIFIRTRTFSFMDLLSDFLGIMAFSILAVKSYAAVLNFFDKPWRGPQRFRANR